MKNKPVFDSMSEKFGRFVIRQIIQRPKLFGAAGVLATAAVGYMKYMQPTLDFFNYISK